MAVRHKIDSMMSRRNFLRVAIGAAALAYVDSCTPSSAEAYAPDVIVARKLFKPVTVDGKWTYEDEWNEEGNTGLGDANPEYVHHFKMTTKGTATKEGMTIAKVKHDEENNLYVLEEFLTDPSISGVEGPWGMGDKALVNFLKGNHVYVFQAEWKDPKNLVPSAMRCRPGYNLDRKTIEDLNPNDYFTAASSCDTSIYGQSQHVIYEWKIFREFFEGKTQIPIQLMTYDSATDTTAVWPVLATISDANKFGKLEISSDVVIPEYPLGMNQYSNVAGLGIAMTSLGILIGRLSPRDRITRREFMFEKK